MSEKGAPAEADNEYWSLGSILSEAYALHSTKDADLRDPQTGEPTDELKLAQGVVTRFLAKTAPPGSAKAAWLHEVQKNVLAFSRDLDRRKTQLRKREREAAEELKERLVGTQKSQGLNASLAAIWKKSLPILSVLVGAVTTQTIKPIDFDQPASGLANSVVSWVLIGAVAAVAFSLAFRSCTVLYASVRNFQMKGRHFKYCHLARRLCLEGEQDAQRFYLSELQRAYRTLMGGELPDVVTYLNVIQGDMRREAALYEELFGAGIVPWVVRLIQPWILTLPTRGGPHPFERNQPKPAE